MKTPSDLRSILQYVPQFRGQTFVLWLDGDVAVVHPWLSRILQDIGVLRSLNIQIVTVYGAGQYHERASLHGKELSGTIEAVSRILNDILQGLSIAGVRAAAVNAAHLHDEKLDVNGPLLQRFLAQGVTPLLGPSAYDAASDFVTVSSMDLAVATAKAIKAAKLVFLAANALSETTAGHAPNHLSIESVNEILQNLDNAETSLSPAQEADRDLLRCAREACHGGVNRVHVLPGLTDGAMLQEFFSSEGVGSLIFADDYRNIRKMTRRDLDNVLDLLKPGIERKELVPRDSSGLLAQLDDFWIIEADDIILGCVALHEYPEEGLAELASLYIRESLAGRGYGMMLLRFVEKEAAKRGFRQLFALSTQTFSFFERKGGFHQASPAILPEARRQKWESSKRNSKVLLKELRSSH